MTSICNERLMREQYRRCVALNNIGVSLMERGAFRQSLQVLRDGIVSMKILSKALCPNNEEETDILIGADCSHFRQQPQNVFAATEADLTKAIRLTAAIKVRPSASSACPLQVISDDAGFHALQLIQQQQNPTRFKTCHPIRIEDVGENRNFDLDAGIILCNFATAHLCQSRIMRHNEKDAVRLQEGAYAIGCVAFERLSSLIHSDDSGLLPDHNPGNSTFFQDQVRCDTAIFLATMATLKTLVLVSHEGGRPQEAKECFQRLLYLAAAVNDATAFDECTITVASAA